MKKRVRRRYRVLPNVTIIIIMTIFMILCNFPLFVHTLSSDAYEKVSAQEKDKGYDGLIALFPKVTVSYKYNDTDYEEYFIDYNNIIFNDKSFNNEIYVNKSSPSNILYVHNFWDSYLNIAFVLVNVICVIIIINNVRRIVLQYVEERFNREVTRGAKQIIKREKEQEQKITKERVKEEEIR